MFSFPRASVNKKTSTSSPPLKHVLKRLESYLHILSRGILLKHETMRLLKWTMNFRINIVKISAYNIIENIRTYRLPFYANIRNHLKMNLHSLK